MKKEVIYISIAAIAAVCGFAIGTMVGKKHHETIASGTGELTEETSETSESVNDTNDEELYSDKIRDLEYRSESEDPEESLSDEEEEVLFDAKENESVKEYKKENYGKIEPLTREEWEKHLYQEVSDADYSADDLYYFPDGDFLTDDRGGILKPTEKYVGDVLDKFRFRTNDDEELYLRNHPMETDFAIHKVHQSRDEYFS